MPVGPLSLLSSLPRLKVLDMRSYESTPVSPVRNAFSAGRSCRNRSLCGPISVLSVAIQLIEMSMQPKTFFPRGSPTDLCDRIGDPQGGAPAFRHQAFQWGC